MSDAHPRRAFCSHVSPDKPAVLAFARRLRERGIDAWVDAWEIAPGDDIIAKMDEGLAADVGLILLYNVIAEGRRVIPVMIDADAPLPEFLKPRARRMPTSTRSPTPSSGATAARRWDPHGTRADGDASATAHNLRSVRPADRAIVCCTSAVLALPAV